MFNFALSNSLDRNTIDPLFLKLQTTWKPFWRGLKTFRASRYFKQLSHRLHKLLRRNNLISSRGLIFHVLTFTSCPLINQNNLPFVASGKFEILCHMQRKYIHRKFPEGITFSKLTTCSLHVCAREKANLKVYLSKLVKEDVQNQNHERFSRHQPPTQRNT